MFVNAVLNLFIIILITIVCSKAQILVKSKNDNKVMNDYDTPNTFTEFCHSMYSKDNGFLSAFCMVMNTILDYIAFDSDEIKKCLNKLPTKYSSGPDNVPSVFLKKVAGSLSVPLALLFQKPLVTSKIPKIWKYANVIPIFKRKGSKFDVLNYRPFSLTSNICMIMEYIVY